MKLAAFGARQASGVKATTHCDSRPGRTLQSGGPWGKVLQKAEGSFFCGSLQHHRIKAAFLRCPAWSAAILYAEGQRNGPLIPNTTQLIKKALRRFDVGTLSTFSYDNMKKIYIIFRDIYIYICIRPSQQSCSEINVIGMYGMPFPPFPALL